MNPMIKKSLIASSIALAIGAPAAQASLVATGYGALTTDRANFTMLDGNGYLVGGTNDVSMYWDGNAFTSSSDYTGPGSVANVTASSTQGFFGHSWTAHDIQVFVPGSYSFDVTLGGGAAESGTLNATVGSGQLGMHMLFDWNGNNNIDVFVVAQGGAFGAGIARSSNVLGCTATSLGGSATQANCLWDGPAYAGGNSANKPLGNQWWMLSSTDGNGDGIMGIPMPAGGPFADFNANFNANLAPVPVPAAAWLFCSGLLGLAGVARCKKRA